MANYTTLYRDNGKTEETRKLQQSLIDRGYDLGTAGADGIYGQQTESAVRQYQSDNGLDVDGIAGEQTLTSLYGSPTTQQPVTQPETSTLPGQENGQQTTGGSISQGTYEEQYARTYEELMGTEGFSYDLNGDPLWQQYKDSCTAQGKLAAMDNMGQALGMTGGFGSSYAQNVGQQTYQGYLQQMNDRVPELYQLAMQKYDADLALAKDKFYAAGTMADREYAQEQDASDNQRAAYNDLVTRIKNGYTPTDDELTAAGMKRKEADYIASTVADTNIYDNYTYDKATSNTTGPNGEIYTAEEVMQAQAFLGLPETGEWDAKCISTAGAYGYGDISTVLAASYEFVKNDPYKYYTYDETTGNTTGRNGEIYTAEEVMQAQAFLGLEENGVWDASCVSAASAYGCDGISYVLVFANQDPEYKLPTQEDLEQHRADAQIIFYEDDANNFVNTLIHMGYSPEYAYQILVNEHKEHLYVQ